MREYPAINVFAWGKGGTANNQNRNRCGGAGVQIHRADMGSEGANDQSASGRFSVDDVTDEGDGQAYGREQSLDDAPDVVHGSPGPDGDSNENDNNNAGHGSDDKMESIPTPELKTKPMIAKTTADGDQEVSMAMDTDQTMEMEMIYLMMVQKKMLQHLLSEYILMKLFIF